MSKSKSGRIDRLRKRLGRFQEAGGKTAVPLAINLGIDFGTSFTKVAFRDLGTEETGVVPLAGAGAKRPWIRSQLYVSDAGRLSMSADSSGDARRDTSAIGVRYLKMRLAGEHPPPALPTVQGIELDTDVAIRSLSAWFLAEVIRKARRRVMEDHPALVEGRQIDWSANVGVPVQFYDSPQLPVFQEVLRVAWSWSQAEALPETLGSAIEAYDVARKTEVVSDFHAVPEIAAAVQSFIASRQSRPGLYVYFDIGGGTVDGVAFNFIKHAGQRRLNFYSGRVDPIGLEAFAAELFPDGLPKGNVRISELSQCQKQTIASFQDRIRKLVADVVMTAKRKGGNEWNRQSYRDAARHLSTIARLDAGSQAPLLIFLGGGGASDSFYQKTILSTYQEYGHANAGVPPYHLIEVPKPDDFDLQSYPADFFNRCSIAYGLSIPYGEGPEIGLPSQFEEVPPPPPAKGLVGTVDYLDSKDVYD